MVRGIRCVALFLFVLAVAGCASFFVAGQVQSGRQALLMNNPEAALAYFQEAAERNPDYIYQSMNFLEGVWTYVGRAQYALGRYDDARRSFERALSVYKDDAMAQLYLGLAMARSGEEAQGLKYIQMGLRSLSNWIEFLNRGTPYYAFWDPRGEIRTELEKLLAPASGEQIASASSIIENAEWVGRQMEEEIDKVRGDERRQFQRDLDGDGRRGLGLGLGIGF
ncbi:MAG: tetratricopeptide repeat protein [Candidatus Binatia bacterium]